MFHVIARKIACRRPCDAVFHPVRHGYGVIAVAVIGVRLCSASGGPGETAKCANHAKKVRAPRFVPFACFVVPVLIAPPGGHVNIAIDARHYCDGASNRLLPDLRPMIMTAATAIAQRTQMMAILTAVSCINHAMGRSAPWAG